MHQHPIYNISEQDNFVSDNYPEVTDEMNKLHNATIYLPAFYKSDIVISYYKDHCIRTVWANTNPQLANLLISGYYSSWHMESLFAACRQNKLFLSSYESYISTQLSDMSY